MKKIYVKPVIEIELTEIDDLMSASNPGSANYYFGGGSYGNDDDEGGNINGTGDANDDMFDQGAKGMGNFAFTEDFEYSIDM